jgi:TetR/AcrR family transcriptional regulator, fatty acid metabolism regulator protein
VSEETQRSLEAQRSADNALSKDALGKDPEKRARILEAARTILAAKRYDDVPVSEITELAGVAKGTFYLYFPSKADLVAALAEAMHEEIMQTVERALGTPRPIAETIEMMIRSSFSTINNHKALINILELDALLRDPLTVQDSHYDLRRDSAIRLLEQGQGRGEIDAKINVRITAELMGGVMIPLARVFLFGTQEFDPESYLTEAVAFVQRALGVARAE